MTDDTSAALRSKRTMNKHNNSKRLACGEGGCPLVIITWEDSRQPDPNWVRLGDLAEDQKAVHCASVGWLIRDTPDVKVLCQSMGDIDDSCGDMQASGVMVIPARCVLSIAELEEVIGILDEQQGKSRVSAAAIERFSLHDPQPPENDSAPSTEVDGAVNGSGVSAPEFGGSRPSSPTG